MVHINVPEFRNTDDYVPGDLNIGYLHFGMTTNTQEQLCGDDVKPWAYPYPEAAR